MQKTKQDRAQTKTDLKTEKKAKAKKNKMFGIRQEEMRQTSIAILKELHKLEQMAYSKEINQFVFALVRKRMNGTPLRAFFVRKMFELGNALKWWPSSFSTSQKKAFSKLGFQQLPFLFELVISIQYLHNQILDKKANVLSSKEVNKNLLAANLLKELLYEYIEQEIPLQWRSQITTTIRKTFTQVDVGQYIEKEWNTHQAFQRHDLPLHYKISPKVDQEVDLSALSAVTERLQNELPREHWEFAHLYLKRIYLTCGMLFVQATKLIIDLHQIKGAKAQQLIRFSTCYGVMRQIVNDNADYLPSQLQLTTKSKHAEDALSDFRNRNITLPLILHLSLPKGNELSKELLLYSSTSLNSEQEQALFQEMLNSKSLFISIQYTKILAALSQHFLAMDHPAAALLRATCDIVHWNKFLYPIKKSKQYKKFKRTTYYKKTNVFIEELKSVAEAKPSELMLGMKNQVAHLLGYALRPFSAHQQIQSKINV